MKAASLSEIKKELNTLPPARLAELCLSLARFKKESKEMLSYLLFEAHDEDNYIAGVKKLMDEQLADMNTSQVYLAKKTIRKVLRTVNKYAGYSRKELTEIELRIYFCIILKESAVLDKNNSVLTNIYIRQIDKIKSVVKKLHEDLQSDYGEELKALELNETGFFSKIKKLKIGW